MTWVHLPLEISGVFLLFTLLVSFFSSNTLVMLSRECKRYDFRFPGWLFWEGRVEPVG